jgi:hypothetical protein
MATLSLGRLVARPLGRLSSRSFDFLGEVWCLSRERRALQALDDAALKDIGLTRVDIEVELNKPFWRR